jgi:outer membrane protein OmpA-like peptidoglycan-associated protein
LDIYGNSGALIQSIKPIGQNTFSYTRAAPEAAWMNSAEVVVPQVFAIQLGNDLGPQDIATLFDENDNKLYDCKIDEDGFVELGNLTAGKAYRLQLDKGGIAKDDRLLILDGNGDTSQTVRPTGVDNYIFEYMMYDGYGKEDVTATAVASLKPKSEPDIFKGKIEGYNFQSGSMLLLTKMDGTVVDSIYPAENGAFTMRKLDQNQAYRLMTENETFDMSSKLRVYSKDNKELVSTGVDDNQSFVFGPLEPKEVAKVEVAKSSVLKFTLKGVLNKPVAEPRIEKLTLLDANGDFLSESYTTEDNDFIFSGLQPANKFIIQTQVDDAYSTITVGRSINKDTVVAPIQADGSFVIDFGKKKKAGAEGSAEEDGSDVLEAGSTFDLPSVFYDFNSYRLLPKSKESLDLLVELLNDLPDVRIEIQAHTDSRGPKAYNLTLSQKRAESVVNYLISKGVDRTRLRSKGFGEEQLSNKCADGVRCTETEHALNRRTTFVIL